MSDTTNVLQIPGAQLESITQSDNEISLHFSQVQLLQEMEGTIEDSLWTQAVNLTIKEIETEGELPECPCIIKSGDLVNNIFTYRDHARFQSTGAAKCAAASRLRALVAASALMVNQCNLNKSTCRVISNTSKNNDRPSPAGVTSWKR